MLDTPDTFSCTLARTLPHNIEAEQALLGALMINNDGLEDAPSLSPEHFYDPVHGRIFESLKRLISSGRLASPISMKTTLASDAGLQELGGAQYLINLTEAAVDIFGVKDYARDIRNLALKRQVGQLGLSTARRAFDPTEDDPGALIEGVETELYQLAEAGQPASGFQSFTRAVFGAIEIANRAYQRGGRLAGLSSGLASLDQKLGGFFESDLIILAGRPSMGKTSLATNIAFNVASSFVAGADGAAKPASGGRVGFFSLEMSAEQLATRILSEQSGIPSSKIRDGGLDENGFRRLVEAAQQLDGAPLYIDDTPALSIAALASRARRLKRRHGLDLLIVDYLQLCRGSQRRGDQRVQEISEITQGLKAIAKELSVPVIALSQLSRKVEDREDKRPQLSDLRESGSIEQDADAVLFVFREEYYLSRHEPRGGTPEHSEWAAKLSAVAGCAEVIIGKARHGPIGAANLAFDSTLTRFSDLSSSARP